MILYIFNLAGRMPILHLSKYTVYTPDNNNKYNQI